ncbi:SHOCT domain-containing protein [Cellulomonas hominis]
MTFWQSFFLVVEIFLFFAYLIVLFHIVTDLFRDHRLSGWAKAVWILFLIAIPLLTSLVYLLARGRGMAERQAAAVAGAEREARAYIRQVTAVSPTQELAAAKQLLDDGVITPEEFATLKARALASA